MIKNVGADGCFGECGFGLTDKTIGEILGGLARVTGGCSNAEKEQLKEALKEAEDKYSNAATTAGLSVVAAAAAAAAAVVVR